MIEPNRLSDPRETAARLRVEEIFARLDELGPAIDQLPTPRLDREGREIALADLEQLADRLGRGRLLDEARAAARDALLRREAERWPAGMYGLDPRGSAPVEDRIAQIAAVEDAISVAVMEDLIGPDTAVALGEPGRRMLGLPPLDHVGGDRAGGRRVGADADAGAGDVASERPERPERPAAGDVASGHAARWEPTAADWADAAVGETAIDADHDEPMPGVRGMRALFFGLIALIAVPTALIYGVTSGELLLGLLIAAAVLALCWTFATFRRSG